MRDPNDPFHEAKVAYETARMSYTSVSSLSGTAVYSTVQACENALQALWHTALGSKQRTLNINHKPGVRVKQIGLYPFYSENTKIFIDKQIEWRLQDIRFEHKKAYEEYTKPESHGRSEFIIEGTKDFIYETEAMVTNSDVIKIIKEYKEK